jgi:ribosomal protein S6--L-glutamate ligase
MRIAFLLCARGSDDHRASVSLGLAETVSRLRAKGAEVDLLVPEAEPMDLRHLRPRHDLYVLKSPTPLALSWAGALTAMGAAVVNSYRAHALARDKVASTALLAAAGVPVPASWATGRRAALRPLLDFGVLWVKPFAGRDGLGVRRLAHGHDVSDADDPTDVHGLPLPVVAQREAPSSGLDLKVYAIGQRLWAINRPFPALTALDKLGTPADVTPQIRTSVLRCGTALGLDVYGVDVLISDGRHAVVDVNPFPGYKGVMAAPSHLASYLHDRALRPRAAVA